jgi:hypothetical protein
MAKKKVHAARKNSGKGTKKKVRKSAGRPRAKASAPAASPAAAKVSAVALMNWVHSTTEALINGIPADKATFQTSPTDNHLLWTIGHLATAYSWFASLIDGKTASLPESYDKLFGYKSTPSADLSGYPSLEEVRKSYAAAYQRFNDAVTGLKPADLHKPTAADAHGFANSRLDVIHKTVWHEGWHCGQLSSLRRALGLPPMM